MSDPASVPDPVRVTCPFCGAPESDRIEIDGRRFLVFPCLFTPEVDPTLSDAALAELLGREYAGRGAKYFQGTCDRLHLYVTKGAGARALGAPTDAPP